MKLVDSSVISEPVEFIFSLLNVVVTKHFLSSLIKLSNLFRSPCVYIYTDIYVCMHVCVCIFFVFMVYD